MNKVNVYFRIFFEDPFYVGICERVESDGLTVSRVVFGAEPKDYEFEEYVLENWYELKFSPSTEIAVRQKEIVNPKRLQREVKRQLANVCIGTKSQQALKLLQEEGKLERKRRSRLRREEEQERQFLLKQQKRKEKHKGR